MHQTHYILLGFSPVVKLLVYIHISFKVQEQSYS